jgi:hypothetical protein
VIRAGLSLLALLGAAGPAAAQGCMKCNDHGFFECRRHGKTELALEANALYCSRLARCPECGGARRIECSNCSAQPKAEEEVAADRKGIQTWLKAREEVDAFMGRPLLHVESAHFRMVWEIPEIQVGRKKLDQHESAHLYLGRLEELYQLFLKTFGAKPMDISAKCDIYAWNDAFDHAHAAPKYAGQAGGGGVKLLGPTPVYTFYRDRNRLTDDDDLHRHLVHNVAHLLLSNAWIPMWIGHLKGGWADEGVAHYFEDLLFGLCTNFCYEEVNSNVSFRGGKWRPPVRDMVVKEKFTPFASLAQKNSTNLTTPEHAQSWSLCEYLIGLDGPRFAQLVRLLKGKKGSGEALREVYGWTVVEFETEWKKHVLDSYPPR